MHIRTLDAHANDGGDLPTAKLLLLVCYLALEGPQDRRRLATMFWPASTDPMNRLSVSVGRLRRSHPGAVEADATRVWTSATTDVDVVRDALDGHDLARAVEAHKEPFLWHLHVANLGEELEEWLFRTREDLAHRIARAGLALAEADAREDRHERAAERAGRVLAATGDVVLAREEVALLAALLTAGDSPRAHHVRQEASSLGLDPAPSREAARAWLRRLPAAHGIPHNLAPARTGLVGRDLERLALDGLLDRPDRPLVTLVGPGGIGKSRLAMRVAQDQLDTDRFPAGVYLVSLQALEACAEVPRAIAAAIGATERPADDALDVLLEAIGDRSMLCVLDNFEHVMGAAEPVARVLRHCRGLRLLVTSRRSLGLHEESLFVVEGLPGPGEDADADAVTLAAPAAELFLAKAQRVAPGFEMGPDDVAPLAALCRLTGGNPLALELAGAWVRMLPLSDIAGRIERDVDFLESTASDGRGRHGSLRNVFEHSWRLLSPSDQDALARLSVFRGGFEQEGAKQVAGVELRTLRALLDRSLIRGEADRYERHPLLYRYTAEKLAERPEEEARMRRRHAEYFLDVATKAHARINRADGVRRMDRLEADHANLGAALAWAARRGEDALLVHLCDALVEFWTWRGHHEAAVAWLDVLMGRADPLRDQFRYASCLSRLAYVHLVRGEFDRNGAALETALQIHRRNGDLAGEAEALSYQGMLAVWQGRYAVAHQRYLEGLAVADEVGDEERVARLMNNIGDVRRFRGDFSGARPYYEAALDLERRRENHQMEGNVLGSLGLVALEEGDLKAAARFMADSLRLIDALGIIYSVPTALEHLAVLATASRRPLHAARLWGAAEARREALRVPLDPFAVAYCETSIARARAASDGAGFAAAWDEGRRLTSEAAVAAALTGAEAMGRGQPVVEKA